MDFSEGSCCRVGSWTRPNLFPHRPASSSAAIRHLAILNCYFSRFDYSHCMLLGTSFRCCSPPEAAGKHSEAGRTLWVGFEMRSCSASW